MNDPTSQTQVEAAAAYEEFFVPALFQEWADRVAEAAQLRPNDRVLDVACGTGALTRAVDARVASAGSVVGLDLNPGMLAVAARVAPHLQWHRGTAESLPYPDQTFDVVVSQFGLMFFQNRHASLLEMRRVLVPGGRLALAVWASLDDTPVYGAEVALLERMAGPRAADALRAPFVLGDPLQLAALVADAGFATVQVTSQQGRARFPSIRFLVGADLTGWLPMHGIHLAPDRIEAILTQAERELAPFVAADGTVAFGSPAPIVTAMKGLA